MTDLPMLVVLVALGWGFALRLRRAPTPPPPVHIGAVLPERRAAIDSGAVARAFRRDQ